MCRALRHCEAVLALLSILLQTNKALRWRLTRSLSAPPQELSFQGYLHAPMTNWAAHGGSVHPAMPGCTVPILNIPKAQALWNNAFKVKTKKPKDPIQAMLHCPMCTSAKESLSSPVL